MADRPPALVLCYHAVSERWPDVMSVAPAQLDWQMRFLAERGYRGVTFRDALSAPRTRAIVAVTFDDAFRSVSDVALPILERYGFVGTVFVPTGHVDTGNPMAWPGIDHWVGGPHASSLIGMSWAELQGLADAGWEIGSHTHSHPRLTGLDDGRLRDELRRSRAECERRLARTCTSLAYPYGEVDRRVATAAGEAGYTAAASLSIRAESPVAMQYPRVGVYRGDSPWRFRLKVFGPLRVMRSGLTRRAD